jgi:sulfite reductase (NADPH) flavoprotein alpha-component
LCPFFLPLYLVEEQFPKSLQSNLPPSPLLAIFGPRQGYFDGRHTPKMQLKHDEATGGVAVEARSDISTEFKKVSSALPMGQLMPIANISGPTYATPQLLVQQIAFKLSDKIFSYSPETYDLDIAARDWASQQEKNIHGFETRIVPLQTRVGAGAFALGYIFSKDFDLAKKHVPQSIIAPSSSLRALWKSFDELSLLYSVASPFVAHIAAAEYSAQDGLVAEYGTALQMAGELGLGLVSSASAYDVQHMAIFSTLIAHLLPTLHVYDGVRTARETLRVIDVLSENGLSQVYKALNKSVAALNPRLDVGGKVIELLQAFNEELGTDYKPFSYFGHDAAEVVLVTLGAVETQLAGQVVGRLAAKGVKIGAVGVRIYRPFIEEAFLEVLPQSTRQVAVLGQVHNDAAVTDASVQSVLYSDVLAAISFSDKLAQASVTDVKFAASESLTPELFVDIVNKLAGGGPRLELPLALPNVHQYTFWDVDDSNAQDSPSVIGSLLTRDSTNNVYVHESHDNLLLGGVIRTDIRNSKKTIDTPFAVEAADVSYVGEEKLLKEVSVAAGVRKHGKLILRLPGFKPEEIEKRIPVNVRKEIKDRSLGLFVLDTSYSPAFEKESKILVELAFLKVARPDYSSEDIASLISATDDQPALQECIDALGQCLSAVEVPASWAEVPADFEAPKLASNIKGNSFVGFDKEEPEQTLQVNDWQAAAKGLAFKEAYATQSGLRPDLTVKTSTVTVMENRRLTPLTYDRNIFHIEFDLGDSGLKYNIGEALGIHAENDSVQVQKFIDFYKLNPEDLVNVPSRENPNAFETRTVYQSLTQNIDILGKPPKRFYESLAEFATDEREKAKLAALGGKDGAEDFKHRSEVDTVTYVDILEEFQSAHPPFSDLVRIVSPLKRREYSIASAQAVTPTSVALMIVVVDWVDPKGRTRYGQATRYLSLLPVGARVTVSVKPSVMKLPAKDTAPLIMAGLGTGLAPFRAFCQYRAMQKAQGKEIGAILLYLGSRHQREEYLYGEEWEAYMDAGVITLLGAAFSRDQPHKIYIQDRMRETMKDVVQAYIRDEGSFYLCGPTWPVPDVTEVLMEAVATESKESGKKVEPRKEIERLKEVGRYVLEVY